MLRQGLIPLLITATAWAAEGPPASIGVNFAHPSHDAELRADDTTGFATYAQRGWNNLAGRFPHDDTVARRSDPSNLRDAAGAPTRCGVLWQVNTVYALRGSPADARERLRKAYLDSDKQFHEGVEILIEPVPYPRYDVVVYMDSDASGRTGEVRCGDRRMYFRTTGDLTRPFIEATATTEEAATPANVAVFRDVTGRSTSIRVKALKEGGVGNLGVQAFQIVERR